MDVEQATAFLQALGCDKIKAKAGWVNSSCPLAPWTHTKHADSSPSFGVSIMPGGRSIYYCFACRYGSLEELVQAMELYAGENKAQYNFKLCHQLLDGELRVLPLPEYKEHRQPEQQFEEWPQWWLESFKPVSYCQDAHDYLEKRKVPPELWEKFDLRFDSKRRMIVAPYSNVFSKFAGARGRSILSDVSGAGKHFDYSWQGRNNCKLVWYNEPVLQQPGPAVIVEGQFDCWRVALHYSKVLANLTAKPSAEKMKKLGDCPFIIQIPDNDKTGEESVKIYAHYCAQLGIGHKVLQLGEGVKDPDDCHPEYLRDRIQELL